jgi:hypothetical protein
MNPLWYIVCCCSFNYILYPITNLFFQWKYAKFKDYTIQRQNYILKNYIKYIILRYITVSTLPFTMLVLFNIGNHTNYIHFIGALYASCDTVALMKDMPLSSSTKIHHSITTFLSIINTTINWEQANPILKLLALYTTLSCYSFDVNYCLGMRFLLTEDQQKMMKEKAKQTYLLTCFINWSIHLIYIYNCIHETSVEGKIYFCLIAFVAYDDILLLKWLNH